MPKKFNRNIVLNVNKFQKRILYPVLFSCLVACNAIVLCLAYFYFPAGHEFFFDLTLGDIKPYLPGVLISVSVMLIFIIFWTFYMSNKIVGPYERVLKELDVILTGDKRDGINSRKGDEMFEELLRRINLLIKKLP